MRNRCKAHFLEIEYVKKAQRGLDIELRKKFQGMEFGDFYVFVAKVIEYEELLRKKSQWGMTSMYRLRAMEKRQLPEEMP